MISMGTLTLYYEKERVRFARLAAGAARKAGDYEHPVFGEGPLGAKLMFVGEAPGAEEASLGRPFIGRAGKQLDGLLREAGITREDAFVTNAVKYRPVKDGRRGHCNRPPTGDEIKDGLALLLLEISAAAPEIIATLGNTPLNALLALAGAPPLRIGEVRGKRMDVIINGDQYRLFPLYHPASIIYNTSLKAVLERDLRALNVELTGLTHQEGETNEKLG